MTEETATPKAKRTPSAFCGLKLYRDVKQLVLPPQPGQESPTIVDLPEGTWVYIPVAKGNSPKTVMANADKFAFAGTMQIARLHGKPRTRSVQSVFSWEA